MMIINCMILSVSMTMRVSHWVTPCWSAIPVRSSWMRWETIIPLVLWQWALYTIHLMSAHSITFTLVTWYHSPSNNQIYLVVYNIKVMIWLIYKNWLLNLLAPQFLNILILSIPPRIIFKNLILKSPLQYWLGLRPQMWKKKVWSLIIKCYLFPSLILKRGNRTSGKTITQSISPLR